MSASTYWYVASQGWSDNPAPHSLWVWIGLTGFALNAYVVHGTDAIDPETGVGTSDNTEYDLTLDYRFSAESWPAWIRPLWLRARAVRVEEDFGDRTAVTKDYRVIANYLWTLK